MPYAACCLPAVTQRVALALAVATTQYPLTLPPPAQLSSEQTGRPTDLVGSGTPFGAAHTAVGAGDRVEAAEQGKGWTVSTADHSLNLVRQTRSRTRALRYAPAKPNQTNPCCG